MLINPTFLWLLFLSGKLFFYSQGNKRSLEEEYNIHSHKIKLKSI